MLEEGPSRLFALPLELREEVYKSVLASPAHSSALLQTSHEINAESRKFLYQQPLKFKDQGLWFTWTDETPAELLGNVSDIALHVLDVNLKPILETANHKSLRQSPRLLTAELYQEHANKFKRALTLLPNLRILTIRTPSGRPSHLYCELVTQILDSIGHCCPQLRQLRLEGNFRHYTLNFLSTLTELESLTLEGSSDSTPEATAMILSQIPNLTSLSLILNGAPLSSDPRQHRTCTTQRYSLNGEALQKVQKLGLLSLTETGQLPSPRACLTTNVLDALHNHATLRHLCVRLAYTPDTAIFAAMNRFLQHTPIEHLELDWPNLHALQLEGNGLLASSLRTLWVGIQSLSSAGEFLGLLVMSQHDRCLNLQKVVLVRNAQLCVEMIGAVELISVGTRVDRDDSQFSVSRQRLRDIGIHVAWYTESI